MRSCIYKITNICCIFVHLLINKNSNLCGGESLKRWILDFFKIFAATILTGAVATLTLFGLFLKGFSNALLAVGWHGLVTLIFICTTFSFVGLIVKNRKDIREASVTEDLDDIVISEEQEPRVFDAVTLDLKKLIDKREYGDVIRIGGALSRALWIAGEYQNRIIIGNLVYEAACSTQNDFARATTLIDDIGWTFTLLNDNLRAKYNITKGITYASKINENYWIAKGYRHLFNIELLEGRGKDCIIKAQEYLSKSEEYATIIENSDSKNEMISGINYDKIELLIFEEDYLEAEASGLSILEEYKLRNDNERASKLLSLLGKLAYIQTDYSKALDFFLEGYATAEKNSRLDEMIKNSMGLAVCKYMDGDFDRYQFYKSKCEGHKKEKNIRLNFWDIILEKYNSIKMKG